MTQLCITLSGLCERNLNLFIPPGRRRKFIFSVHSNGNLFFFNVFKPGDSRPPASSTFHQNLFPLQWQPTPVFLPGESQGRRSLVGCRLWGHTESDMTEATWRQQQQGIYFNCQYKYFVLLYFFHSFIQQIFTEHLDFTTLS